MAVFGWAVLSILAALLSLMPAPAAAATTELVLTGWITVRTIHQSDGSSTLDFTLTDDQGVRTTLLIVDAVLAAHGGARALDRQHATVIGDAAAALPPGVTSGVTVHSIRPAPTSDAGLRASADSATTSAVEATAVSTKRFVTLLCRFGDMTGVTPHPVSWYEGLVNSTTYPGMAHYFATGSYGALSLEGSVVKGWYNLPRPKSSYASGGVNLDLLADDCTAAAEADVDFRQFYGINLMFNSDWSGQNSVGGTWSLALDGVIRVYGITWIPVSGYKHHGIVAHEMSHALGLVHSSGAYGTPYDSLWDVLSDPLGSCHQPHPTYLCVGTGTISYHKDALGWIPSARRHVAAAGTSATIDLEFLSEPASGNSLLMAMLPIDGSSTLFYTVEARDLTGYDREVPGRAVVIHKVDRALFDREAQVVDPDKNGNPNDNGAMFLPGETFTDAARGISVHVVAATATGFQVRVANGVTTNATLTVVPSGDGTGRVTSTPGDIDCGGDCTQAYTTSSVVRLHAAPSTGSVFAGWSGGGCSGTNDCSVTLNADQTVTARFVLAASMAPDLVVTAVSDPPTTSVASGKFPLTTTVANQGASASSSSRLRFYLSFDGVWDAGDTLLSGTTSFSLAAAATRTVTVTVTVPSTMATGLYTVLACADDLHAVAEGNEANNCKAAARQVSLQAPDLTVSALDEPPASVARGGKFTFSETVKNQGAAEAKSSRVRYYFSLDGVKSAGDTLLGGTRGVGDLDPGAVSTKTVTVTVPSTAPLGTHHLLACADDLNAVVELVETNNCRSSTGTVVVTP